MSYFSIATRENPPFLHLEFTGKKRERGRKRGPKREYYLVRVNIS
jgi:hypothetical protein